MYCLFNGYTKYYLLKWQTILLLALMHHISLAQQKNTAKEILRAIEIKYQKNTNYLISHKFKSSIATDTSIHQYSILEVVHNNIFQFLSINLLGNNFNNKASFNRTIFSNSIYLELNDSLKKAITYKPKLFYNTGYYKVYNTLLFFSKNIQEKTIRILNQNDNIVHFEYNDYHYVYNTTDSLITKVYKVNFSKFGIEYAEYNIKILPTVNSNSTLDTLINFIKHNYTFITEDELINTPLITKKSVGEKFPPFAVTSIQGINYNNNSLLGKVVVIDFFYQSCLPCVKLIPELNELVKEVDTGKMIVIGVDHRLDDTLNMKDFIKRYNIQYPIICGVDGELLYSFSNNTLFPHTVVLNKEGEIAYFSEGYTKGIFKKLKEAVLKELEK